MSDFGVIGRRLGGAKRDRDEHWGSTEEAADEELHSNSVKLAGFYVGPGLYGIDIMRIKEVIQSRAFPVRPVPHAPAAIEGVITLRGVVIPVVDLRRRFNVDVDEETSRLNKLIVVSVRGRIVGLKVDRVVGEIRAAIRDVRPAPSMLSQPSGEDDEYFSGVCNIGEDVLFVLNLDGLFSAKKEGGE